MTSDEALDQLIEAYSGTCPDREEALSVLEVVGRTGITLDRLVFEARHADGAMPLDEFILSIGKPVGQRELTEADFPW